MPLSWFFKRSREKHVSRCDEVKRLVREVADLGLPDEVWGTKGFEFWTFLALLLKRAGSKRILELGSGRSTISFAEYAKFAGAELVSIETSAEWFKKSRLDLFFLGLPPDAVKHVEIDADSGWYRLKEFRSNVSGQFDCVLIDAPNDDRGDSRGKRDSATAISELRKVCRGADLVIIDDVHRRHVFDTLDGTLSDSDAYDTYFFDYGVQAAFLNSLSISVKKSSAAAKSMPSIQDFLSLKLSREGRSAEACPEP